MNTMSIFLFQKRRVSPFMLSVKKLIPIKWLPWLFRTFACFQFFSAIAILFVLVHTIKGSWFTRAFYILENQWLVILSWISSMLGIGAMSSIFLVLIGFLNPKYRLVLNWAWMISLIGGVALCINHIIQMFLIPILSEYLLLMPSEQLFVHLHQWDQLLFPIMMFFGPSCIAICGFAFTLAMFKTKPFSSLLSWWSFAIWFILFISAISGRWFLPAVPVLQVIAIFLYAPWLWKIGKDLSTSPELFVRD